MPGAGVCAIAAADPGLRDGRDLPGVPAVVILLQVLDGEFLSCNFCWVWFAQYYPGLHPGNFFFRQLVRNAQEIRTERGGCMASHATTSNTAPLLTCIYREARQLLTVSAAPSV